MLTKEELAGFEILPRSYKNKGGTLSPVTSRTRLVPAHPRGRAEVHICLSQFPSGQSVQPTAGELCGVMDEQLAHRAGTKRCGGWGDIRLVTGGVPEGSCAVQHPHQQPGHRTLINTK